jgi:hypothetical protein
MRLRVSTKWTSSFEHSKKRVAIEPEQVRNERRRERERERKEKRGEREIENITVTVILMSR